MKFRAEPAYAHDQVQRIGVLLVNLGTPEAPTASAVRRYLAEFLSDHRVVEIPRLIWLPILYGIILLVRPARSARKYAGVWTAAGSPLAVHTEAQSRALSAILEARYPGRVVVDWAMRYGARAMGDRLSALRAAGCDRLVVVPLYPQYAASTTASTSDALGTWLARTRHQPDVRFIKHFHRDPRYIAALAARVQAHWQAQGRSELLVMSFHGVPRRSLDLGDPYHCECYVTARLLAEHLQLQPTQYKVTFQSRFGRAKWLEPYTEPTLEALAHSGTQSVDVICPGFVSDCLETLEEINLEARATFLSAGGKRFSYIECLNEEATWMDALAGLVEDHAHTWLSQNESVDMRNARADRARQIGAER